MTTIAISGSRSLASPIAVEGAFLRALQRLGREPDLERQSYVHGGAGGVDSLVDAYLRSVHWVHEIEVIRPDYDRYGNGAPFIRNQQIIDKADALVAIWDGKSKGTIHAIGLAKKRGLPIAVEVI